MQKQGHPQAQGPFLEFCIKKATKPYYTPREWRTLSFEMSREFWASIGQPANSQAETPVQVGISDVFDLEDAPELGVLLRTDFSDDEAWGRFSAVLQDAENEMVAEDSIMMDQGREANNPSAPPNQAQNDEEVEMQSNDSGSSREEEEPGAIIRAINPSFPEGKQVLNGISNLTALRMFNTVDIQRAPPIPPDTKRAKPNKLVNFKGWQEIYVGKSIWIYDTKSNSDKCVRVVSGRGDVYGTATLVRFRSLN